MLAPGPKAPPRSLVRPLELADSRDVWFEEGAPAQVDSKSSSFGGATFFFLPACLRGENRKGCPPAHWGTRSRREEASGSLRRSEEGEEFGQRSWGQEGGAVRGVP